MSEPDLLRIGLAQLYVCAGCPEKNLARAGKLIHHAAELGAQVVVLPECCDLGWTDDAARQLALPIPEGASFQALATAARAAAVYVVAGLTERSQTRIYNSAVCISPEGALLGLHRKINELEIARRLYCLGDRLSVVETPLGVWGINICADNLNSSLALADTQCRMGARVILSPCAWAADVPDPDRFVYALDGWRIPYVRLARHHRVGVVGVSNVGALPTGPWAGKKAIGCSLAVDPEGELLANLPTGFTPAHETVQVVKMPLWPMTAYGTGLPSLFADN